MSTPSVAIRRATPADDSPILALAREALGWEESPRQAAFFAWKHRENPFGTSPAWVATSDGAVVAFRTFLRWEFRRADGGIARAVRAVDTATHPDFRGQGLFRDLTLGAVDDLAKQGVDFVFNTPNDQSRPGYLHMGWQEVGRPTLWMRATGLASATRLIKARAPATKWSEPASFGEPAGEAFADEGRPPTMGQTVDPMAMTTNRSTAFLRWRYGFGPLGYRLVRRSPRLADGFAVVRLRRRGAAVEGAVCELAAPPGDRHAVSDLLGQVDGADYLLLARRHRPARSGLWPLPRQGPIVTWRALGEVTAPRLSGWDLTLGDLELF